MSSFVNHVSSAATVFLVSLDELYIGKNKLHSSDRERSTNLTTEMLVQPVFIYQALTSL